MRMRPSNEVVNTGGLAIMDLPLTLSAEKVFSDFLKYLYSEAVLFIKDTQADGPGIWEKVKERVNFVLSHPNNWSGLPQQRLRKSAILGNLIPDTDEGNERLAFVTEGEASALSCLSGGLGPSDWEVRNLTGEPIH